ncbi:8679_t:CDS:10, partial [Cetraspora pellucida]
FDLMEESSSKWQKKTKVFQLIEEDSEAEFGLTTQGKETPTPEIIDQKDESEKDSKNLDKKHQEIWQKSIQIAKDMFKVDNAEYAFSTWFAEIESKKYEAGMTEKRAQEILNAIDNGEFLIRIKFIRNDSASRKYIRGSPNVILTKKTKQEFWVGIDKKFLVREVSEQSKSDVNRLMPIKDGKFIQSRKNKEKQLTHHLVIDEGELDFLIKDCTDAETFARRERLRIVTDSIYIQKEALYKIKNISAFFNQVEVKLDPNLYSYYPSCAMCSDSEEFLILKSEYAKWIKEFLKTKRPLVKYEYSCQKQLNQQEEQESKKIYEPVADIVYWPKNRYWKSIKDISDSTASSIHDLITRYQKSYLNEKGGFEKHNVKAQTWHSFFRWNGVEEWTSEHMGEKKFL